MSRTSITSFASNSFSSRSSSNVGPDIQIHINGAVAPDGRAVFEPADVPLDIASAAARAGEDPEIAPWLTPPELPPDEHHKAHATPSSKFSFPKPFSRHKSPSTTHLHHTLPNPSSVSIPTSYPSEVSLPKTLSGPQSSHSPRHRNHSNLSLSIVHNSLASDSPQLSPTSPSPERSRGSLRKKASNFSLFKKRSRSRLATDSPRGSEDSSHPPPLPSHIPSELGGWASASVINLPPDPSLDSAPASGSKSKNHSGHSHRTRRLPFKPSSGALSTSAGSVGDPDDRTQDSPSSSHVHSPTKREGEDKGVYYHLDQDLDNMADIIDETKVTVADGPYVTGLPAPSGALTSRTSSNSLQTNSYTGLSLNGGNSSMSSMRTTDIDEMSISPSDCSVPHSMSSYNSLKTGRHYQHGRSSSTESYGVPLVSGLNGTAPLSIHNGSGPNNISSSSTMATIQFGNPWAPSSESPSGSGGQRSQRLPQHALRYGAYGTIDPRTRTSSNDSASSNMSIAKALGGTGGPLSHQDGKRRELGSLASVKSDATMVPATSGGGSPLSTEVVYAGLGTGSDAAWQPPESWETNLNGDEGHPEEEQYSTDDDDPNASGVIANSHSSTIHPTPHRKRSSLGGAKGLNGVILEEDIPPPVPPKPPVSRKSKRRKTPTDGNLPNGKASLSLLAPHPGSRGGSFDSQMRRPSSAGKEEKYQIRVYKGDGTYHMALMPLHSTVDQLRPALYQKLLLGQDKEAHRLYLKEWGRERMLAPTDKPAVIVRRRMQQAGYDYADGIELLSGDRLNFLLKFVFKTQLLGGVHEEREFKLDNFEFIDLTARGLRAIPISLHQNAESIVSLRLSRNPMLDIPLDFIQSCTTLRELRLSHMAMKKVPESLRHCLTLHRLDLSCNRIVDLDGAFLDNIPSLTTLFVQNNRIEKIPWHFPRIRSLITLNISNNKFHNFPQELTQLETLKDLDVSFNRLVDLPDEIGNLKSLERFILVGNQVARFPDTTAQLVNLKVLDCRRNLIGDLSIVCSLPKMETLSADHNNVAALDMSLGPNLAMLDVNHNDITKLTLLPGLEGKLPYALTVLDISNAKLSSLDDIAISRLPALKTLRLARNSFTSIPESFGELQHLETLCVSDNSLSALPVSVGRLQRLESLDAHNNSIQELPPTLWHCSRLKVLNFTSNMLSQWLDAPLAPPSQPDERKASAGSVTSSRILPPLALSLERLYLGENSLTEEGLVMLTILKELKVLNLSFNDLQDIPPTLLKSLPNLEELYLSGNKLSSLPAEELPKLQKLTSLYLNGNKLNSLPQELGKLRSLAILDVGSNVLKYNINNWEFDWNWNFNKNLQYLNLSGNDRLQIRDALKPLYRHSRDISNIPAVNGTRALSGFSALSQLRVLGLMDVTIAARGLSNGVDIPDELDDRRVRTSMSIINGMSYGIADTLGKNRQLNMLDLVYEFRDRPGEAVFAMFGRAEPPKHVPAGVNTNRLAKFLHDNFIKTFTSQLESIRRSPKTVQDVLRRTYLQLNQDLHDMLYNSSRIDATSSSQPLVDPTVARSGASGVTLYFAGTRLYVANVGNVQAVLSRSGNAELLTTHHLPYDRGEIARIRAAEGWISPPGLINDEIDISRSFGFYHLLPFVNARPDIRVRDLSEGDEFLIVANRGLWDFVSYQTAVDIARQELCERRTDLAAQKLRDFALSYGAQGSTMIMVIGVADLFNDTSNRVRQGMGDSVESPILSYPKKRKEPRTGQKELNRLPDVEPPTGHLALVFTDIRNSTPLWEANPGMPTAMRIHNALLRRHLALCGGYEVKTEGDSFMAAFPSALSALRWCLVVQLHLLEEPWPLEILECEDGKEVVDAERRVVARGLSVRMGMHCGEPSICQVDPITRRMDYFGPMVIRSARIGASAKGGQIACSAEVVREIKATILGTEPPTPYSDAQSKEAVEYIQEIGIEVVDMGEVKLKGLENPEWLSVVYPKVLKGRHQYLQEKTAETSASDSRVQFSIGQMRELGMLCLRLEALSSNRVFRTSHPPLDHSPTEEAENENTSNIVYGDPAALLPPMSEKSSDLELMLLLDSLSVRIDNALASISSLFSPPKPTFKEQFLYYLAQRGLQATVFSEVLSALQQWEG